MFNFLKKKIVLVLLFSFLLFGNHSCEHFDGGYSGQNNLLGSPGVQRATVTCFKSSEYTSGFNKICNYNCLGSARAITIANTQLCPLTIQGN
jgi:hypothetical protein